jgi:outer membrane receptor protein involved in Fe transport
MSRRLAGPLIVLLLCLILPGSLLSQVTTGSISGYVFDPAGRPIPAAQVKLVDVLHPSVRSVTTSPTGSYRFIGLPPTIYTVSAVAPGFSESTQSGVTLAVDMELVLDLHLALGSVKTRIEVSSPLPTLQTETAELGLVADQELTSTLPLNQRNFLQLALLTPGVFPSVEGSQLSSYGSFAMHVNGGREEYNDFLLDGVDNNDPYVNRYVVDPAVDSVQEFKIATNSYSADYGRSAAGQINVITRRGTNNFHATAYEYLRNKVLDARNYFDGAEKPPYIRNQFGAAVGGPIFKEKAYFFVNTDFLRQRQSQSHLSSVPTDDERAGRLGALGVTIVNPLTGGSFPGNNIPSQSISPIATDILKLYPEPNLPGTVGNYLGHPVEPWNQTQNTFRVDQQLRSTDNLTFRYNMGIVDIFEPYPVGVDAAPGFGDYVNDHTHNAMIQETHTFGANAVNSLLFGFNRFSRDFLPQNYQTNVGALWGVSWLNLVPRDYGYPSISVGGFSQVGDSTSFPNLRHTNTYQITDGFTLNHGHHLFKMGGEIRKIQLNGHLDELVRGSMSFPGAISGSGISDLLLGYPSFALQAQVNNPIRLRSTTYAGYFQDDWKLSPTLVLNLGLRYEYNSPATDPTNGMSELNLKTGQIVQVGTNGVTASGINPDYRNFAPRVGISWTPKQNMVVRAGYGVFYDSGMFIVGSAAYFNPPQFTLNVFFPSAAGLLTLQNPFPSGAGYTPPASPAVLSPNIITPYLQQWNFTVEGNVGRQGTLTMSYAGSNGSHLIQTRDLNQPPPGPGDLQSRRPYPQYGSIFFVESAASSNFNALEAHFVRHMTSGLALWVAYTYSHSIDGQSAFLGDTADPNFPQNSNNLPAERASSSFDMRQRFVAAYVITLPRGNMWTRNMEFQGIATTQTGQPFTPIISFDNSNTGNTGQQSGSDRPNRIGNPHLAHPSAGEWFNTAAFAVAPPYTFGNAGRNSLLGPRYNSFDISLLRRFSLPERGSLTLEAQAFNLFNHTNFNLPVAIADQPSFGNIFSANAPRQLQFAVRLTF